MKDQTQSNRTQSINKLQSTKYLLVGASLIAFGGIIGYAIGIKTPRNRDNHLALQQLSPHATDTPQPMLTKIPSMPTESFAASTPTPDPITANWQTYTDTNSGVSFKYPPSWSQDPNGSLIGDTPLVFHANGGNPKMDPIRITFAIITNTYTNNSSWTADDWFAYIAKKNNAPNLQYDHLTISGYPAIRNMQTIAYEEYEIIAPVKNLNRHNAEYLILFSNLGEGLSNPYPLTDPFLQQANTDFHRMLSSFSIKQY